MHDSAKLEIHFFLSIKQPAYAVRFWYQAPRVGEEVLLMFPPGSGNRVAHRVTFVVWGVEHEMSSRQCVNVMLEQVIEE